MVDLLVQVREALLIGRFAGFDSLQQALHFELLAHQPANQFFLAGFETEIEFGIDFIEFGFEFGLALGQCLLLVPANPALLFAFGNLFVHVADRLSKQLLRFLYAIQDGVKIGFEEPRNSVDQCHCRSPSVVSVSTGEHRRQRQSAITDTLL
jgi:hypothetical protein